MKKLSILALAVAGMLAVGCADKDLEANQQNAGSLDGQGQGYFKVNISMPKPASTRADWTEDGTGILDDGDADEFAVESAILLLFDGATESTATLVQTINLDTDVNTISDSPNQITEDVAKDYIAKLDEQPSNNLYALAVINGMGVIEAGESTSKIKVNGTQIEAPTIGDIQSKIASSSAVDSNPFIWKNGSDKNRFFMTNAVLFNNQGGSKQPVADGATNHDDWHILAPVDAAKIYLTEAEAQGGEPATDIYVERGVAKVTITQSTTSGKTFLTLNSGITTKGGSAPTVSFTGWTLDNTNTQSYVVRQVPAYSENVFDWNFTSYQSTTDKYRFVGGFPVDGYYGTQAAGYRTYWAKDPNYDATGTFSSAASASGDGVNNAVDAKLYCFENTFNVANQVFKETTRALIKVTFGGGDFYTIGADKKTLYPLDELKKVVATDLLGQSDFATALNAHDANGYNVTYDKITVTFDNTEAGVRTVKSVKIAGSAWTASGVSDLDITNESSDPNKNIIATLNNQLARVEYFKGGVSYYQIRIKHFGDYTTPWNDSEYSTADDGAYKPKEASAQLSGELDAAYKERMVAAIYPNGASGENRQARNYLGRYGMVRNNWYDLEIQDILRIGSATVPELTDHPDDELEDLYIRARINVLSWAKRPQTWQLK